MVSFTTTFVAVIGFVSLAQPIAAAPLAMVAASAVGGLVSGHKIRDDSALWERTTATGGKVNQFADCKNKMTTTHKPSVKKNGKVVTISNLPPVCMVAVKAYNGQPKDAAKKAQEGTATILNANTVRLDNMPAQIVDMLDG